MTAHGIISARGDFHGTMKNYYLVGYDSEAELIKHYRVDKMLHIRMSTEAREGKEHFKQLDMADYAKEKLRNVRWKRKDRKAFGR